MKVVIIGGGTGGYSCAIRFAQLGADVILVEKGSLGGVCLNEGCIPTKTLLGAANMLYELKENARQYGITVDNVSFDWNQLKKYKDIVIRRLQNGVKGLLQINRVSVVNGTATFINERQINVDGKIIEFDAAVVAVGSSSLVPTGIAEKPEDVISSTEALTLDNLPQSLCIIGGGVIGCELATAFSAFGVKVTVIEYLDNILNGFDKKQTEVIKTSLKKKGVKFYLSSKVESVKIIPEGEEITFLKDGESNAIQAEKVLVAMGRKANTDNLNLAAAGVELDGGLIKTGKYYRTTTENIYAIGDCASKIQLAYVASSQGKQVAEYVMTHKESENAIIPLCVFTIPEIAKVGASTDDIDASMLHAEFPFMASGKAVSAQHTEGSVKVVADKEAHTIKGVSIVGHGATELIAEATLAVNKGMTLEELAEIVHAHPVMSEGLGIAVEMLLGSSIDYPPVNN